MTKHITVIGEGTSRPAAEEERNIGAADRPRFDQQDPALAALRVREVRGVQRTQEEDIEEEEEEESIAMKEEGLIRDARTPLTQVLNIRSIRNQSVPIHVIIKQERS